MPTYVYRREDGSTFEIQQRITDPSFKICPTTGQPVTRLISPGAGLVFKGSGFYLTDYARAGRNGDGSPKKSPKTASSNTSESSTKSSTSDSTDTDSTKKPDGGDSSASAKKDGD